MAVKVAINGFGRIGRNVLRAIIESGRTDIEVVAINDLADIHTNAHLLKYDSVHGRFPGTVEAREGVLVVNGHEIKVVQVRDPAQLPWGDMGVEIALECSGIFTKRDDAAKGEQAFLHRGIAARGFVRSFVLADGLEVQGARLEHGLLHVDLIRPEAERAVRRIPITVG